MTGKKVDLEHLVSADRYTAKAGDFELISPPPKKKSAPVKKKVSTKKDAKK